MSSSKFSSFLYFTKVIWHKEIQYYLTSVTGFLVIALNAFLLGSFFTILIELLNQEPTDVPLTELFYDSYFFWIILFLGTPLITMRSYSYEASKGILDATLTTQIPTISVVVGKWLACFSFFILTWLPWIGCMGAIYWIPESPPPFDFLQWVSTGLGLSVIGGYLMALGCFFSSLSKNQIMSAMATLAVSLVFFALSFTDRWANPNESNFQAILSQFGMVNHMGDFVRGIVDSRPIIFYLSTTSLLLYMTVISIEKRRWHS